MCRNDCNTIHNTDWYFLNTDAAMSIAKKAGFATSEWNETADNEKRIIHQKNWMTTVFFHTWLTATVRSTPRELPYNLHDIVRLEVKLI